LHEEPPVLAVVAPSALLELEGHATREGVPALLPQARHVFRMKHARAEIGRGHLTIAEVTSADFRARVFHPEDVARLREERRDALARGVPFELEQRARRHDGQYRWFLVQYNPVRDEHGQTLRWYATGTDIDDRKRAEERVR